MAGYSLIISMSPSSYTPLVIKGYRLEDFLGHRIPKEGAWTMPSPGFAINGQWYFCEKKNIWQVGIRTFIIISTLPVGLQ
jgi:hypothetical protein